MTTEERIIDSAATLFSRKGYKNTSIKEIAQKAEVNSLTIFRYFHDKDTLFFRAVEHMKQHPFSSDKLDKMLSFQNVTEDLMTISLAYMDEIYVRLPLIRIYIGEGINFEQLKEERWYVSPDLKMHFSSYIRKLDCACPLAKQDAEFLSEIFVSYIIRKVMYNSKQHGIWEKTSEIEASFRESFFPLAKYIASLISG